MKRRINLLALSLLLAVLSLGAALEPLKPETAAVLNESNAFALALHARLAAQKPGNLIYSPFSISMALAAPYAGARGETAREMQQVLRYPADPAALLAAYGNASEDLNERGKKHFKLIVANRLWIQTGYQLLPSFTDLVKRHLGEVFASLDFSGAPANAVGAINAWAKAQTLGRFDQIVSEGDIDKAVMVVTNAIYFKGRWDYEFESDDTSNAPFWLSATQKVEVPTMNQTEDFMAAKVPGLSLLELPYRGGEVAMIILLPEKRDGLAEMEARLTLDDLNNYLAALSENEVHVALPKFRMESEFEVKDCLEAMGMKSAFTLGAADFSGIANTRDLFISQIVHKAFVEVNEEGTEAAAATVGIMTCGGEPPSRITEFIVDHPFLFLIRDKTTGSFLFIGRVTNPTSGGQ